jgi:hypothetical protein
MKNLICLGGRKGSGKSEISKSLVDFRVVSFADELRNIISKLYDTPVSVLKDPVLKEQVFSKPLEWSDEVCDKLSKTVDQTIVNSQEPRQFTKWRQVLQFIGTDVLQKHDKQFHVKATVNKLDPNFNYVCDDVRFMHELNAFKQCSNFKFQDFYLIKPDNWIISNHISETELNWSLFQRIIINDGTKEDLLNKFSLVQELNEGFKLTNTAFLEHNTESKEMADFVFKYGKLEINKFIISHNDFYKFAIFKKYLNQHRKHSASPFFDFVRIGGELQLTIDCPIILENLKYWYNH